MNEMKEIAKPKAALELQVVGSIKILVEAASGK